MDADGYFWHEGRTDDLIVSAGYKDFSRRD